ncbi:MAG: hypothetical protein PHN48_10190, partial [Parabacteroides sp.]|nr:hypothetical protein [Parabacteroides sp.]
SFNQNITYKGCPKGIPFSFVFSLALPVLFADSTQLFGNDSIKISIFIVLFYLFSYLYPKEFM